MDTLRAAAILGWFVIIVGLAMVIWFTYLDYRSKR